MPDLAEAFMRLRVDAVQLRRDIERGAEGAGLGGAGERAGGRFSAGMRRGLHIAGLAAGATAVAIGAIGVESAKMATQFQASMTKIRTQAGGSASDVRSLTKSVLDLASSRAQQSPLELANALYHLKSVGLDNVAAMRALRTSSDLAAVGGADLESTTNALAGAWRSGVKGAQNFGDAAATVNAIIGAGNMRMEDFVTAIGTGILASARTFGVSLKSVGSALALMTDEGVPAVDAATRLRMSFSLLGAPSATALKQLDSIGVSGIALANAMRGPQGLIGAIGLLKAHLDASGLSASRQAALLSRAFGGGRSSSAILTLINNFDVLRRKQDQINASMGRFGPAVTAQRATAAAQFARLRAELDVIGIRIGLALLPPVTQFAHFVGSTLVPGAVRAAVVVSRAFHAVIPVAAIERDWDRLMTFLGLRKPKRSALVTGDLIHLPKPAPLSTADLIHLPRVVPAVPMSVDLLHGSPQAAPQAAQTLAATLGAALGRVNWGQVIAHAVSAAASGAQQIGAGFLTLLGKVNWLAVGKETAFIMVPLAIGLVNNLLSALIFEAVHHPMDMVVFVTSIIPIGRLAGVVSKLFGEVPLLGPLIKMFARPLEIAGGVVERLFARFLRLIFGGAAERVGGYFAGARGWLTDKGTSIVLGLWYAAEHTWGRVMDWLGTLRGMLLRPFDAAGRWLLNAGGDIIGGLLRGIRAKLGGIGSWVKSVIVDPIVNWVKHWFGIHSPSTVMAGVGGHLMSGLFRGLLRGGAALGGVVRRVFGSMPSALGAIVSKGLVSVEQLPGRALHALEGLGGKVWGFLSHLFGGGGAVGGGVARWAPLVLQVLRMLGQPASALPIVLRQIATESGGNPLAQNNTDINALLGHPSKGLMQTIGPTFDTYAGPFRALGIWNPLANIYAGLHYAISRYGRSGWMGVLGQGHGYSNGGPIPEDVMGVGLRSGERYTFHSDEEVMPAGWWRRRGGRGGATVNIAHLHVRERADVDLIAQRLGFMLEGA